MISFEEQLVRWEAELQILDSVSGIVRGLGLDEALLENIRAAILESGSHEELLDSLGDLFDALKERA